MQRGLLVLCALLLSPASALRVCVVGGGAAGYFAAIHAAKVNPGSNQVTVLEAGPTPLSKVLISGGGRCNVMHDPMKEPKEIAKGYPRGSKELLGLLSSRYSPWDTYDFFSSRLPSGVTLKTEGDGRVFPSSDRSETIANILEGEARKLRVDVRPGCKVSSITRVQGEGVGDNEGDNEGDDEGVGGGIFSISYTGGKIEADRVILATGSSRQGYALAQSLGHKIVSPVPSLFSFKVADANLTALAGVSTTSARLTLQLSKEQRASPALKPFCRPALLPLYSQSGPLLITHQGISGPAVLRLSAYGARVLHALGYAFTLRVSWLGGGGSGVGTGGLSFAAGAGAGAGAGASELPRATEEEMLKHLEACKKRFPSRLVGTSFPPFVPSGPGPDAGAGAGWRAGAEEEGGEEEGEGGGSSSLTLYRRLWQYLLQRCDIPASTPWARLSNKSLSLLAATLMDCPVEVVGRGEYRDEFVSAGGVPLNEVDFKTLESKVCRGLFLCGELLDIDGVTGGYNFQSSWSTGFVGGTAAGTATA